MEFLAHVKLLGYMGFRVPSTSKETRSPEMRSQRVPPFSLMLGRSILRVQMNLLLYEGIGTAC